MQEQEKNKHSSNAHSKNDHPAHKKESSDGMAMRGVSRPMAEQEVRQHEAKMQERTKDGEHLSHSEHEEHSEGHHMMMDEGGKQMMLSMHHKQTLWVYWLVVMLGFWTILSPLTFSYAKGIVEPSGGREVWLSLTDRITVMKWSDIISGLLLVIFGWRSLTPNRPISMWICCFVGVWLTVAPILFWAPTAVAYLNDTLVGALVIALTILIPGMPNMILHMQMGPETPPGWSYNPSSWPQRAIMIALAFVGWVVSRYLTTFQLGYIDHAWDPFFGESTKQVLNSSMSHSMPISDAGLGAIAYTIEFMMGFMGSPARWRTMPWMVTFFGLLVIPLGLVHIFLVISQPLMVGAWCTLCILAAGIMLPMIPLQVDEVIAMGQFMAKAKRKGQSLWSAFWMGGTLEGGQPKDERSPDLVTLPWQFRNVFNSSLWGMSFPWTLVVSTLLGIGLVVAPGLLGVGIKQTAADVNHLGGSLIVVFSVIAMAEPLRIARYTNVLLGLAVASIPWFVSGSTLALNITCLIAGLAVAALALPRGPKRETYGSWDRYIK
jgi:hypothetical protein